MNVTMQWNRDIIISEYIAFVVAVGFLVLGVVAWLAGWFDYQPDLAAEPPASGEPAGVPTPEPATGLEVLDRAYTTVALPPAETYAGRAELPHHQGSYYERSRDALRRLQLDAAWAVRHRMPWVGEYEHQPVPVEDDAQGAAAETQPIDFLVDPLPPQVLDAMRTTPGTEPVKWPLNSSRWSTTYQATGVQ